jgi:hypothetical protein
MPVRSCTIFAKGTSFLHGRLGAISMMPVSWLALGAPMPIAVVSCPLSGCQVLPDVDLFSVFCQLDLLVVL